MGKLLWTLPEIGGGGSPTLNSSEAGKVLFQTTGEQLPVLGCLCTHLMWKAWVYFSDLKIPSLRSLCAVRSGVEVAPLLGWKVIPSGWERSAGLACGIFTWPHLLPPHLWAQSSWHQGDAGVWWGEGCLQLPVDIGSEKNPSYKQDIEMPLSVESS